MLLFSVPLLIQLLIFVFTSDNIGVPAADTHHAHRVPIIGSIGETRL